MEPIELDDRAIPMSPHFETATFQTRVDAAFSLLDEILGDHNEHHWHFMPQDKTDQFTIEVASANRIDYIETKEWDSAHPFYTLRVNGILRAAPKTLAEDMATHHITRERQLTTERGEIIDCVSMAVPTSISYTSTGSSIFGTLISGIPRLFSVAGEHNTSLNGLRCARQNGERRRIVFCDNDQIPLCGAILMSDGRENTRCGIIVRAARDSALGKRLAANPLCVLEYLLTFQNSKPKPY